MLLYIATKVNIKLYILLLININLDIYQFIITFRGKVKKWPLIAFKDRGHEREGIDGKGKGQGGAS
jgi:hypothetical protein